MPSKIPQSKNLKVKPKVKGKQKSAVFQTPRGMHDILPEAQARWERVRAMVKDIASSYNFSRIDTPIVEFAELFARGVGEETDVVGKEMYTLKTKGGDLLALRPEATAPIVRAYMQHSLGRGGQPVKVYYEGPMFRHDNPQAGRYRQFFQAGFEILGGPSDAIFDAQVIVLFDRFFKSLKLGDIGVKINSIGCRVCRPFYKKQLYAYYKQRTKELCADCTRRLDTNILRLLDCKKEGCRALTEDAPNILNHICAACTTHLKSVLEYLDELKIPYGLDKTLVRGLDYYSRTVFEMGAENAGAELGAIASGGRYDYLFETLGGHVTPATGGAMGLDRVVELMKIKEVALPAAAKKKVFVIYVGDLAKRKALSLLEELRASGIPTKEAFGKESLRNQLKMADKEGAPLVAIVGQKEIYEKTVILRELRGGLQESIPLTRIVEEIKRRLKTIKGS